MKAGIVLEGKYRLTSLLGEGGMGAVWRAEHLVLGAPVAVKLMHAQAAGSALVRARFDAEARTAASLRSPHVVQILDFGVDPESQTPFIVMELLEGESLRDRLDRLGRLPAPDVARIMTHVARALERAHEVNVIHRDLKPANIFLVRNADAEVAKVLDFGIAKSASHLSPHGSTATGMLLGTPHYMSPEQIRSSKSVNASTDLWSLGVIAFECLTGKLPFDADNLPGLALAICHGEAAPPSSLAAVPRGFDAWFKRATGATPAARFASAVQMAAELRELCGVAAEPSAIPGPVASGGAGAAARAARVAEPFDGVVESTLEQNAPQRELSSVGPLSRTKDATAPARRRGLVGWGAVAAGIAALLLSVGGAYRWRTASQGAEPAAASSPVVESPAAAPVIPSPVSPVEHAEGESEPAAAAPAKVAPIVTVVDTPPNTSPPMASPSVAESSKAVPRPAATKKEVASELQRSSSDAKRTAQTKVPRVRHESKQQKPLAAAQPAPPAAQQDPSPPPPAPSPAVTPGPASGRDNP